MDIDKEVREFAKALDLPVFDDTKITGCSIRLIGNELELVEILKDETQAVTTIFSARSAEELLLMIRAARMGIAIAFASLEQESGCYNEPLGWVLTQVILGQRKSWSDQ